MVQIKSSLGSKRWKREPSDQRIKIILGFFFITVKKKKLIKSNMLKRVVANALAKNNPGVVADGKFEHQVNFD